MIIVSFYKTSFFQEDIKAMRLLQAAKPKLTRLRTFKTLQTRAKTPKHFALAIRIIIRKIIRKNKNSTQLSYKKCQPNFFFKNPFLGVWCTSDMNISIISGIFELRIFSIYHYSFLVYFEKISTVCKIKVWQRWRIA